MLHPLGMDRARQQGAGQKGPQLRGQADLLGQQGHEEAQPQGEDQQHLVVHQPHQLFHQGGHQVNPQNQPQGQGEDQQADPLGQGPAADGLGDGDGGQDHHGEDGKQVLNDQGAHGQAGKLLLLHPQIFHVLHGNHGGGHGQHDPQKEAVHGAPAQGQAQQDPHAPMPAAWMPADKSPDPHLRQLVQGELQPQAEHEEDHPDVRPDLNAAPVLDGGQKIHHRPGQKPGQDVPQHRGEVDFLTQQGGSGGDHQDDGQVNDQGRDLVQWDGLLQSSLGTGFPVFSLVIIRTLGPHCNSSRGNFPPAPLFRPDSSSA